MGVVSRTADLFYAFRFLKLLVTPWNKMGAYEQGIIDENGKNLKKAKELTTSQEKEVYTVFHRLVFNLKRSRVIFICYFQNIVSTDEDNGHFISLLISRLINSAFRCGRPKSPSEIIAQFTGYK